MIADLEPGIEFTFHCHANPLENDALMDTLPPGSLVINATGMGKDLPGSPITDSGRFPWNGVAWELNYRGELQFLNQALAQREERQLTVEDGWVYFLHGWTEVIAQVIGFSLDEAKFARLANDCRSDSAACAAVEPGYLRAPLAAKTPTRTQRSVLAGGSKSKGRCRRNYRAYRRSPYQSDFELARSPRCLATKYSIGVPSSSSPMLFNSNAGLPDRTPSNLASVRLRAIASMVRNP